MRFEAPPTEIIPYRDPVCAPRRPARCAVGVRAVGLWCRLPCGHGAGVKAFAGLSGFVGGDARALHVNEQSIC